MQVVAQSIQTLLQVVQPLCGRANVIDVRAVLVIAEPVFELPVGGVGEQAPIGPGQRACQAWLRRFGVKRATAAQADHGLAQQRAMPPEALGQCLSVHFDPTQYALA